MSRPPKEQEWHCPMHGHGVKVESPEQYPMPTGATFWMAWCAEPGNPDDICGRVCERYTDVTCTYDPTGERCSCGSSVRLDPGLHVVCALTGEKLVSPDRANFVEPKKLGFSLYYERCQYNESALVAWAQTSLVTPDQCHDNYITQNAS